MRAASRKLSYLRRLPLPRAEVTRIASVVEPLRFDRIYGAFCDRDITSEARRRVQESADRSVVWLTGQGTDARVA